MAYDFAKKLGELRMAEGDVCNMSACVRAFQAVDPGVQIIKTYSGYELDTTFQIQNGRWAAL